MDKIAKQLTSYDRNLSLAKNSLSDLIEKLTRSALNLRNIQIKPGKDESVTDIQKAQEKIEYIRTRQDECSQILAQIDIQVRALMGAFNPHALTVRTRSSRQLKALEEVQEQEKLQKQMQEVSIGLNKLKDKENVMQNLNAAPQFKNAFLSLFTITTDMERQRVQDENRATASASSSSSNIQPLNLNQG